MPEYNIDELIKKNKELELQLENANKEITQLKEQLSNATYEEEEERCENCDGVTQAWIDDVYETMRDKLRHSDTCECDNSSINSY